MLLPVSGNGLLCQSLAVFPRLRVGGVVGVDAEHIPARWQYIVVEDRVSSRGRCYSPSIQCTDHIVDLCLSGG